MPALQVFLDEVSRLLRLTTKSCRINQINPVMEFKMNKREQFFAVLENLMWEDGHAAISAKLIHTEPIKEVYIQSGSMLTYPSYGELHTWLPDAGYANLGVCFARCYGSGRGTFWTRYPDIFTMCGVTDSKSVQLCVNRRRLYLKVKPLLREKSVFTVGEVSALFGKSINTVRQWDEKGWLPAGRTTGGHRRYDLSDLVTFEL